MKKSLSLFTLMLCIGLSSHTQAYTSITSGECVKQVIPQSGKTAGIAASTPEQGLLLQLCDGDYATAQLMDGKLKLHSATRNQVSSQAHFNQQQNNALPDGEVSSSKQFKAVWLTGPTNRYAHGILGDSIEASGIAAIDQNGRRYDFTLDHDSVFEDRRVRLADLDGDGNEELIVVRSYLDYGASLAVYGVRKINNVTKLVHIAETAAIGLSNRWLNPAVITDVDGDGTLEIAYVETPHIGGTLHVLSLKNNKLISKYQIHGVSNHAIGSRNLDIAAAIDWNQDGVADIAVPNANRTAINIYSFKSGQVRKLATIKTQGKIDSPIIAADLDGNARAELHYRNNSGLLVSVAP